MGKERGARSAKMNEVGVEEEGVDRVSIEKRPERKAKVVKVRGIIEKEVEK